MIEIGQDYQVFPNWKEFIRIETTYLACQMTEQFKVKLPDNSYEEREVGDWLIKDVINKNVFSMDNENFQKIFKEKSFV